MIRKKVTTEKKKGHQNVDLDLSTIRYDGFDVSWAGPGPKDRLCVGFLDGRILFADMTGRTTNEPELVSRSAAAVNGVAFLGLKSMAVSTPSDLSFVASAAGHTVRAVFACGAHGVVAADSGEFLAPLGPQGLAVVRPDPEGNQTVVVRQLPNHANFYRVASIPAKAHTMFACALRSMGLCSLSLSEKDATVAQFSGLDIVDICPLKSGTAAVAAVSRDCTLILSHDIAADRNPVSLRFDGVDGVAYRILAAKGHLLLLTSKGVYVVGRLPERFLAHQEISQVGSPVRKVVLKAIDCNLLEDGRKIAFVLPTGLIVCSLDRIIGDVPLVSEKSTRSKWAGTDSWKILNSQLTARSRAPTWSTDQRMSEKIAMTSIAG